MGLLDVYAEQAKDMLLYTLLSTVGEKGSVRTSPIASANLQGIVSGHRKNYSQFWQ